MSHVAETSSYLSSLRERATVQLTDGIQSNPTRTGTSEAMAVLFKLASSSSTAADALAMLHELQVHQVEVDMQYDELNRSQAELENQLIRQTKLVDRAPAGFLVIDEVTVLCEINCAGVRLLGAAGREVLGRPLGGFLSPVGRVQLHKMLTQARNGALPETCELDLLLPEGGVSRKLLCTVDREVSSGRFLLVLLAPPSASQGWPA